MKVFTRDYNITGEYHPLWQDYFGDMKPCVLDIEATGLDRTRCKAVLTGFLMHTERGVRITQFLAENHYEEPKVLDASMEYIEKNAAGYLITFNGYAYDVPFINARLSACMDRRQIHMYNFDLYRFLRKSTDMRTRLSSMSQMSIEDHYGILSDRGDTINGKESVRLFDQYALSGNSTLEKIILTHNREDVLHLHRLMYLTLADAVPDIHSALAAYGFPAEEGRFSVRPHIKRSGSARNPKYTLKINGEQLRDPISCAYFRDADQPASVVFNKGTSSFEIELPVSHHGGDCYLDVSFLAEGKGLQLRSDPDYINGYLILNPRTINLISRILVAEYSK